MVVFFRNLICLLIGVLLVLQKIMSIHLTKLSLSSIYVQWLGSINI